MKKLITLILAISMIFTLAVATSASSDVVKKGTATVDGELDNAYLNSLVIKDCGTKPNALNESEVGAWPFTCKADFYFLYDDSRLYVYCDVTDDDPLTLGKAFLEKYNTYQVDLVEMRFSFNGDPHDIFKVSIDSHGYTIFGLTAHYEKIDYSTFEYKTKLTDKGYAIEVSIPCTKGDLDMIKTGKLGFTYSLNDLNNDGIHYEYAESYDYKGVSTGKEWTAVFYDLSNEYASGTAPVTTKAPETTPAPEETTEAPEADTTAAEAEDTTVAEVEDSTAAEGEDTTVAEEETTAAEGEEDTTVAEGEEDTTVAEGEDETTADEGEEDTTAGKDDENKGDGDKTNEGGDKKDNTGLIIGIVAAVIVIAGVAVVLSKKKKN
ncbi:MAG: hypothetical protein IJY93_02990 [Clostridia bacterium]|nr:hypothetical protein [Clostridia bacterium]